MGFLSAFMGDDAAEAARGAAADQYGKQQAATAATRQAGNDYQSALYGLSERYNPYVQAGGSALERLLGGLGLRGQEGSAGFAQGYQSTPGYQEGLNTGIQTLDRSANARGMTNSGRTLKDLYRFGSGYENQRSGDYLNRLASLAGSGMSATQAQVGTAGQGYGGQLQANLAAGGQQFNSAGTIGQGDIAAANAESAGAQNLVNAGLKLGGMALGSFGQGGAFGKPYGGSSFGSSSYPMGQSNAPNYPNPYGGSWYG